MGHGIERQRRQLQHAGHQRRLGGTPLQQHLGTRAALARGQQAGDLPAAQLLAGRGGVLAAGPAEVQHGALQAQGTAGQADRRPELHHGLVVVAGRVAPAAARRCRRDQVVGRTQQQGAGRGGLLLRQS